MWETNFQTLNVDAKSEFTIINLNRVTFFINHHSIINEERNKLYFLISVMSSSLNY